MQICRSSYSSWSVYCVLIVPSTMSPKSIRRIAGSCSSNAMLRRASSVLLHEIVLLPLSATMPPQQLGLPGGSPGDGAGSKKVVSFTVTLQPFCPTAWWVFEAIALALNVWAALVAAAFTLAKSACRHTRLHAGSLIRINACAFVTR